ncbi:MAG: hypothetical protein ACKERG_01300 [Candidatus Hodgkinia cicadicola]
MRSLKVLVATKIVADSKVEPKLKDGAVNKTGVERVIDFADEASIQAALDLKRKLAGVSVAVVSVGPIHDRDALRHALAMGTDEVVQVRLVPDLIHTVDSFCVAKLLRRLVIMTECDMILTGSRSSDTGSGQVGTDLAGLLGWPHLSSVYALTELKPDKVLASCRLSGWAISCWLPLPCVLVCDIKVSGPKLVDILDLIKAKNGVWELKLFISLTPTWASALLLKSAYQLRSSDSSACFMVCSKPAWSLASDLIVLDAS